MKTLLSARQLFKELGLSYDQGLSEVRRGNLTMLKKPNGENLYADRSEVVRWRLNRNREALGLAPIQPPTTAQELMVLDMLFMYKKDPDDEMYYMTDYERDWVAKKQEEANAKEEVEVEASDEEVETASQDVEVDENNTEEDSEDVDDTESEASDSETEEDSETDTNEAEEESVEESELAEEKQTEDSANEELENSDTDKENE